MLPRFNNGQDFLFFSTWQFFSPGLPQEVRDLTWDNGQTFMYRDHRGLAYRSDFNGRKLFELLSSGDYVTLRLKYKSVLLEACKCQNIELVTLAGNHYQHGIQKQTLPIVAREPL